MKDIQKNAEEILLNEGKLKEFAELNRLAVDVAKNILETLIKEPEIADEFKSYIFSNERSQDFKGYTAGEEKGYQRGHEAGFAKGAALGVIGVLTVAGLALLARVR